MKTHVRMVTHPWWVSTNNGSYSVYVLPVATRFTVTPTGKGWVVCTFGINPRFKHLRLPMRANCVGLRQHSIRVD